MERQSDGYLVGKVYSFDGEAGIIITEKTISILIIISKNSSLGVICSKNIICSS